MNKLALILVSLFIVGCGKVDVEDSNHDIGGEVKIVVYVGFDLEPIAELCHDFLLEYEFATLELYDQAVAECVFDKIGGLSVNLPDNNCYVQNNQIICDPAQ